VDGWASGGRAPITASFPPGRARLPTTPDFNGVGHPHDDNRDALRGNPWQLWPSEYDRQDGINFEPQQIFRQSRKSLAYSCCIPYLYADAAAFYIAELVKFVSKGFQQPGLKVLGENANSVRRTRLLSCGDEWPRCRRAAQDCDELAPPHSIISSARASNIGGRSSPRTRTVGKLMTSSNLVDRTTGKSAGLAPLRIRPV